MNITIRPALKTDCPRMMELIRELAHYEKAPEQVTVSMEHFENSGFGQQPIWWAIVAEMDDRVEGFALYYIRYSTWKGQRMYLEDILVTEAMRGKGAGALLMNELMKIARQKNLNGITWQVLNWNEPAIRFYQKIDGIRMDPEWVNVMLDFE